MTWEQVMELNRTAQLRQLMTEYLQQFATMASRFDGTTDRSAELVTVIDAYSAFITEEANRAAWEQLEQEAGPELARLAEELRRTSARCVSIMEKYRALKLLNGNAARTEYFQNIESCIETEFGSFQISSGSKVLMVGAGSFPMTPLMIARRTDAEVIGIDIDAEAVRLGRKVAELLGSGLRIRLERASVEQLADAGDLTHIIFSSTIAQKYELLDRLHPLTNGRVVAAVRYGDRLKSLFNYPSQQVDARKWKLVDTILRPDHVFDIALYQKA